MKRIIKSKCEWDTFEEIKYISCLYTWQITLNDKKTHIADIMSHCLQDLENMKKDNLKESFINNASIIKYKFYNWKKK